MARSAKSVRILSLSALICLGVLPGCAVGKNYRAPEVSVPNEWSSSPKDVEYLQEDVGAWWNLFDDATLGSLIDRAAKANLSVREAAARVDEARALYRSAVGEFYPEVDGAGHLERTGFSKNSSQFPFPNRTTYGMGLNLNWELDLFGRTRRSIEYSRALADLSLEERRGVFVSLFADVGQTYIELRTAQERLRVSQENLAAQQKTLELTQVRRDSGLASELDVAQAESSVAETKTSLPRLEMQISQTIHRLSVLLGSPPNTLRQELGSQLNAKCKIPELHQNLRAYIPANLIRQRPDIRRAERDLAAQTALIGVSEGELYPRLSLAGTVELTTTTSSPLFDADSLAYSIGPRFQWRILEFGRVRALVAAREAGADAAAARYQRVVLQGLQEVEDALEQITHERERRIATQEAVRAARKAFELSSELYKAGLIDFQNVLDSQRSLLVFESNYAESQGTVNLAVVALYRALGGGWGWQETTEAPPSMPDGILAKLVDRLTP